MNYIIFKFFLELYRKISVGGIWIVYGDLVDDLLEKDGCYDGV